MTHPRVVANHNNSTMLYRAIFVVGMFFICSSAAGTHYKRSAKRYPTKEPTSELECVGDELPRNHLIHLPTHEGLISQYLQLEILYTILRNMGIDKTIIAVPFQSHHFANTSDISLCDLLRLPATVRCSCHTETDVGKLQQFCPMVGSKSSWSTHPESYGLDPNRTNITMAVDLRKESCVAGILHGLHYSPLYKDVLAENKRKVQLPLEFTSKYEDLAECWLQRYHHSKGKHRDGGGSVVVIHWRRGDQLTTRCKSNNAHYQDRSVNCGTAEEFVTLVKSRLWDEVSHKGKHNTVVYVATNENDPQKLAQIHAAGFHTAANWTNTNTKNANQRTVGKKKTDERSQLSTLDVFVLELYLMCQAKHFWHWGNSGTHTFVERCRKARSSRS